MTLPVSSERCARITIGFVLFLQGLVWLAPGVLQAQPNPTPDPTMPNVFYGQRSTQRRLRGTLPGGPWVRSRRLLFSCDAPDPRIAAVGDASQVSVDGPDRLCRGQQARIRVQRRPHSDTEVEYPMIWRASQRPSACLLFRT